jgi:ATP-binding cassette, subfamily B, bacterial HlyB/CyaB
MTKNSNPTDRPADLSWFTQSTLRFIPLMVELIAISIVVKLIGLIEPFVFQTLIDRVLPFQRVASLTLILVVLVGSTLFSSLLSALAGLLGAQISNRLTHEMGARIFRHSLSLPTSFLQRFQIGELLARMGEIETVRSFLTSTVIELVLDLLFTVIYIGVLYTISPLLTLILLLMIPLQAISFGVFGPFIRRRTQAAFAASSMNYSRLVEAFGNPITVKSLAIEDVQSSRVTQTLGDSLFAQWNLTKVHVASETFGRMLRGLSVVLIIYFGAGQVFQGLLTFGQLVAFHLLSEHVAGPILSLSKIWEKWQGLRIARLRLGDLLNHEGEQDARLPILMPNSLAQLEVRNILFSYVENHPVFKDLSLILPNQETTVIVGDSGCGKSTLAKILSGLYCADSGDVLFGKANLAEHDPNSVRKRIAYVAQEPLLFAGTIRENLIIASPAASEQAIDAVLTATMSKNFVAQLPNGIDTQVGDKGSFLSGGQRQRIAVARSLLMEPDILILDEPTSSLDEETANKVMETLSKLSKSKTVVIITHRPDLVLGKPNIIDLNKLLGRQNG